MLPEYPDSVVAPPLLEDSKLTEDDFIAEFFKGFHLDDQGILADQVLDMNPLHPANQPFDFRVSFRSLVTLSATDSTGPYSVRFEMIPMIDAPTRLFAAVYDSSRALLTYFSTVRHGFPDRVRSVLNEGGLPGERAGWHLPGFDTSNWASDSFQRSFLCIPPGFDVMLSFTFDDSAQPYRALLFVNGWMMGKRVANLGPQFKLPVHQGILDYNGTKSVPLFMNVFKSRC
ncbi:galactose-binding domain-like protein [Lactarius hengduanensis]|nr:galactose-binding domain-like protein [Lactarius hengduanensis]